MDRECELLSRIRRTAAGAEKDRLIEELDALPATSWSFHDRWTRVYETWEFDGWTDEGYDASKVSLPRDIQILSAVQYGISDICNGGLHQFFGNGTGVFAPEMVEWFDRAGMPAAADIMRLALTKFGGAYSRSQEQRCAFLDSFRLEAECVDSDRPRSDWDPFYELDDRFYDCLSGGSVNPFDAAFTAAADRWLRETCGIRKLSDPPGAATSRE